MRLIKRIFRKANKECLKLQHLINNKALILIYHRVIDLKLDPQLLAVTPENFEAQIKFLSNNYNIISLTQLINDLYNGKIKNKSVVITFDDGYFDNFHFAKPILEKYELPATFFISTGYVDGKKEYWWDELENIFLVNCPHKKLTVLINGLLYEKDISLNNAINVYRKIHLELKKLTHTERDKIMSQLSTWAGIREKRETHISMNSDEIIELSKNPLFEIGAHTVNHPVLANESLKVLNKEIINSKLNLESLLKKEINLFSYPFGGFYDYNNQTVNVIKKYGFDSGIANIQGYVTTGVNPYSIPRYLIRNWSVKQFANEVKMGFKTLAYESFTH